VAVVLDRTNEEVPIKDSSSSSVGLLKDEETKEPTATNGVQREETVAKREGEAEEGKEEEEEAVIDVLKNYSEEEGGGIEEELDNHLSPEQLDALLHGEDASSSQGRLFDITLIAVRELTKIP